MVRHTFQIIVTIGANLDVAYADRLSRIMGPYNVLSR